MAEHMLDAVSDPQSLQRLLEQHSVDGKQRQYASGGSGDVLSMAALGSGEASWDMLPVSLSAGGADEVAAAGSAPSNGTPTTGSKLAASWQGSSGDMSAAAAGLGVAAQGQAAAKGAPGGPLQYQQRPRPSLSRELAVVFWRTLVDIARNPMLLLLHWCAAGCPRCPAAQRWAMLAAASLPAACFASVIPTDVCSVIRRFSCFLSCAGLPMCVLACRALALLMGVFVGAVFFQVTFDTSGAQNRVGECA